MNTGMFQNSQFVRHRLVLVMTGSSTSRGSSEGGDLETEIHVNDDRRRGKNNSELVRPERIPKVARS